MLPVTGDKTGWDAWSPEQAQQSKTYFELRKLRLEREQKDLLKRQTAKSSAKLKTLTNDPIAEQTRKKAIIEAAMARAKEQLEKSKPKAID